MKVLIHPSQLEAISVPSPLVQRRCACGGTPGPDGECAACKAKRLRRQEHAKLAPPIVHDVLRSTGEPLDAGVRADMEARLGHDFSRVRVHTDERAAASARSVEATAFAIGSHVVFGSGRYAPRTSEGSGLLAHELVHVVQQRNVAEPPPAALEVGACNSAAEADAERLSSMGGGAGTATSAVGLNRALLQRTCAANPNRAFYETAANYCRDSESTGQLHPGQTCFREIPRRARYLDCPPGDQVCFDGAGRCFDSWDLASPVEGKDPDGTCNLHFACSLSHAVKDKVIQTWLDQELEEVGRRNRQCVEACNTQPWYLRGFCLQGCSGGPSMMPM